LAKLAQIADFPENSAIICPLFAAALNVAGSNAMQAVGSIASASANFAGGISDRFGIPI
jgi:hypothetical protein